MKTLTLREARDNARLTQDELAEKSGISQAAISAIERGARTNPTRDTQDRLAKALGIAPSELRFSEPEPESENVTASSDRQGHEDVKAS
jgi:transcriptional regulator with XRE-family HTH domain